jgi:hypothetical protein
MMGMMFFKSWIISQKPTVKTVGYVMEMMFFESGITDFTRANGDAPHFGIAPTFPPGQRRREHRVSTAPQSTEMKFPDGMAFFTPYHVGANHYSPNTPWCISFAQHTTTHHHNGYDVMPLQHRRRGRARTGQALSLPTLHRN